MKRYNASFYHGGPYVSLTIKLLKLRSNVCWLKFKKVLQLELSLRISFELKVLSYLR